MSNPAHTLELENEELSIEELSLEGLYLSYRVRLLSVIGRYIRCPNEREDVLHDMFLRLHRTLPDFRGDAALYTWLYRIAVNTSLNHIRKPSYRGVLLNDSQSEKSPDVLCNNGPESLAIAEESAEQLVEVMSGLEWSNKDAFLLYSQSGLSYESIAMLLHCPVGTVRSRIARTRKNLRRCVENS